MPVEVLMPKLGLTMTEGKIVDWKKNEGDSVTRGDILFVLETEKVAYEVEAAADGTLGRVLVPKDETVQVGTIVAYLLEKGESLDAIPISPSPKEAGKTSAPVKSPASGDDLSSTGITGVSSSRGRVRATPLAKRIARELGIDLLTVAGSGPAGRIVADDVRQAGSGTETTRAQHIPQPSGEDRILPLDGMRQTIAANMMAAKRETAQTYMSVAVDASRLVSGRAALLPHVEEKYSVRLTITDLMMKLVGHGIGQHPVINTRWTKEGIVYLADVHMGMAMSVDNGLVVPVIKNINTKGLGQIARERVELMGKVRGKKYIPDDIKGSTFTLSTLGMFGIESFTANINCPESAILAVGAIVDKVVPRDGQIVVRPMMNVMLTYDHRIIDGAEAAKFMQTLTQLIEEPVILLA